MTAHRELTQEPLTRAQRITVYATFLVIASTRLVALAKGPWDWDEILFCMAVDDYDVVAHQPHPPGFPLYIFLARIARLFVRSDFHALQIVNVVAAMAVFPVMFLVARAFRFRFIPSFWAAFLFAFLPNVWFYGGTAFSDEPAMVLFLGCIAAFLFAARNGDAKTYGIASIVLAAALMVRPQNVMVAIFPWALATLCFARAKRWRAVLTGVSLTAGLTILGYGIGAWATGLAAYVDAFYRHFLYVRAADSVTAAARPPLYEVVSMMLDPFQAGKVSILLNVLALIGIARGLFREPRQPLREIFLTFAPFFLFAMFAVNPLGSSRFSLNWIAGVVLLAALGVQTLANVVPRASIAIYACFLLLFVARLIPWTLPAFAQPKHSDAPPVAAAKWVAKHVPPETTVFVDESIWPWAKYYIPNHRQVRPHDPSNTLSDAGAANGVYLSMNPQRVRSERTFAWKRDRTWNVVTQRSFEAYVSATREFAKFDRGWWPREGAFPNYYRWSSKRAAMHLAPMRGPTELRLKFEVPLDVIRHPVSVKFTLNGQPLPTYVATTMKNEYRVVVAHPDPRRANVLRLELSDTIIPSRLGGSADWRQLGLMLESWSWQPATSVSATKQASGTQ
ncbi:MAG TPA: hypothetical protein VHW00_20595 [Thermoanaerobaculia bacterium]|nr:hypothetical protein [Thermoanaerobaculia bacterium]